MLILFGISVDSILCLSTKYLYYTIFVIRYQDIFFTFQVKFIIPIYTWKYKSITIKLLQTSAVLTVFCLARPNVCRNCVAIFSSLFGVVFTRQQFQVCMLFPAHLCSGHLSLKSIFRFFLLKSAPCHLQSKILPTF